MVTNSWSLSEAEMGLDTITCTAVGLEELPE